ncbi:glycosyltransferase [uncultured Lentibacter sp.]|uniref:glycosyltransferase n=1 Tax=uncultured Lentibacter sp. TaxID=1659309 RepID=UPI00260ECCB1|nr:glycosyltransferase [uncultured Lentibacter sp.]
MTHNRCAALKVTLARLLAHSCEELACVVVCDNASTDGTSAYLATLTDPRLKRLTLTKNSGGAGGFEAALRFAQAQHPSAWYMLMDDDAYPSTGTVAAFHARAREDYDVWLSGVRYPGGDICDMNRPWRNPFWRASLFLAAVFKGRAATHLGAQAFARGSITEVDGGSFVGQFISRRALTRAGFPRGDLFIYADDVLFCLALRRAGGLIAFDPALAFVHDCNTLTQDSARLISPLWKVYFYHRNLTLAYRQSAGPLLFWPLIALKSLSWLAKAGRYGPAKRSYLSLLGKALQDALNGRTGNSAEEIEAFILPQAPANESAAKATGRKP